MTIDLATHIWGLIGAFLAVLLAGIPAIFTIRAILKEILSLLTTVKGLLDTVQLTLNTIHNTVDKMAGFIDVSEKHHDQLFEFMRMAYDKVSDKIDSQGNRIIDKLE